MSELSLQDRYAPNHACFGCGPKNELGLRLKSFVRGDEVVATWTPAPHHEAFAGVLSGGICGTLLDCHSNWTAAHHLMVKNGSAVPPCTVTAEFHVKLREPTPSRGPLQLSARVVESSSKKAVVEATLASGAEVTATCRGIFVAVKEGHPAFGRWS